MEEATIHLCNVVLMHFCYFKYLSFSQAIQILLLESWPFYMNRYKPVARHQFFKVIAFLLFCRSG